jgi:membrane protease YdiL (CAAX protease family)
VSPDLQRRFAVLVAAAVPLIELFWGPESPPRRLIMAAVGNHEYRGPWILFEHAFVYTLTAAALSVILWVVLARRGLLPPLRDSLRFTPSRPIVLWGVGVGLAVAGLNIAIFAVLAWRGLLEGFSLEYVPPNGWDIGGNVISNFYEELVARGFLVVTMRMVFRNAPIAVAISSLFFGFGHTQYPMFERCFIAVAGAMQCIAYLRTKSLWAPYISHEVYDLILDCAVKVG